GAQFEAFQRVDGAQWSFHDVLLCLTFMDDLCRLTVRLNGFFDPVLIGAALLLLPRHIRRICSC
ncbi:MAG: hypothetical protein P8X39_05630, partial [Desulfofustis sp.]